MENNSSSLQDIADITATVPVAKSSGNKWSIAEDNELKNNLFDGVIISELAKILPKRSDHAIVRRAASFDYGYESNKGNPRLYKGIKKRQKPSLSTIKDNAVDNIVSIPIKSQHDILIECEMLKMSMQMDKRDPTIVLPLLESIKGSVYG